jgi:Glycosyltransferase family 87
VADPVEVNFVENNREAARACLLMGCLFFVVAAVTYIVTLKGASPIPRDASGLVVGRDFLNFWMYGRAAFSAAPWHWYDVVAYQHDLAILLGPDYPGQNWSYPPSVMLIAAPFGLIGYLPALLIWLSISVGLFAIVLWRNAGDRGLLIAAMASPASVFCLVSGQSAFVITAILIAIFAMLDSAPLMAGVLIGLLTLKPQVGLLLPVMLIASGRWRVLASASATSIALVGFSAVLFGTRSWTNFIVQGLPIQNLVLADPGGIATPFYPTVFMNLHGAGLRYDISMIVQLGVTLLAAGAVFWGFRFRRDADPRLLFALFAACAVAATPYLLVYDTLPIVVAALSLLAARGLDSWGRLLARLVYWLPLLQIGLGKFHIPGPALIAPAFAFLVAREIQRQHAMVPSQAGEFPQKALPNSPY